MTIITMGGAGNVGKTTIVELLGQELARRGKPVLCVDANPDQNLMEFAGFSKLQMQETPKLCTDFKAVKIILDGENPFYPDISKIMATSPVTEHTKWWSYDVPGDAITSKFGITRNGVVFMQTGTYSNDQIGGGCIHDLIENLVYTMERLDDGAKGERGGVIVDMVHGRDALTLPFTGLADRVWITTEATEKSLDITRDYIKSAIDVGGKIGHKINVGVIGNKVKNEAQIDRIKQVAGDSYIASVYMDDAFDRDFSNAGPDISSLSDKNQFSLELMGNTFDIVSRDWMRRKTWMAAVHKDTSWYGEDIRKNQISGFVRDVNDAPFSFKKHVHGPNCKHD